MRLFINSLSTVIGTDPSPLFDDLLLLPGYIDAVVGDTIQIYYNAMIVSPYDYWTNIDCSIGDKYPRYYEATPDLAGEYPITVTLQNSDQSTITEATTILRVKSAVQQPATTVNWWSIGDSLTAGDIWPAETQRRLTAIDGTPIGNGFGNIVNHNQGQAGKQWYWFVNDEASPFVYSGVLDFEQYRIDNALDVPQVMYILLTWNGMGAARTQEQWDTWDDDVYTFIDAAKLAFPSLEIKLLNPQLPSQTGSLGIDYGATGDSYSDYFYSLIQARKQAQIYKRIANESGYEYVSHIDTALQFDSLYNMGYVDKDVNTRSAFTEKFGRSNSGVHPRTEGYNQIADCVYRDFINNYCQ